MTEKWVLFPFEPKHMRKNFLQGEWHHFTYQLTSNVHFLLVSIFNYLLEYTEITSRKVSFLPFNIDLWLGNKLSTLHLEHSSYGWVTVVWLYFVSNPWSPWLLCYLKGFLCVFSFTFFTWLSFTCLSKHHKIIFLWQLLQHLNQSPFLWTTLSLDFGHLLQYWCKARPLMSVLHQHCPWTLKKISMAPP